MDDPIPLDDVLFGIVYNLCKEFPALDPFHVEGKPFHDVIVLYSDILRMRRTEKKQTDPDRVIRKKAGDDWF